MNIAATLVAAPKVAKPEDRYEREDGVAFLSGIQALIRLMVDQARSDRQAGLKTGGFVTGYPGPRTWSSG